MSHVQDYLEQAAVIAGAIPAAQIEGLVDELVKLREEMATLYIIGLGGSAANAPQAVPDGREVAR